MKDLEYILATKDIPKYTVEEIETILITECELNGKVHQLSVCMEEFAELIEVLCENVISGRVDTIHLKEELVDCWICLDYLSIIFNIQVLPPVTYYTQENCINNCILNLSTGITRISKCIREKSNAEIKIVSVINMITETLYNIHKYYNISNNDYQMKDIRYLKTERSEVRNTVKIKRISSGTLTQVSTNEEQITVDEKI